MRQQWGIQTTGCKFGRNDNPNISLTERLADFCAIDFLASITTM
jgi:hypothetical protein